MNGNKKNFWDLINSISREIIYTILGIVVIIPLLIGIKEEVQISPAVEAAYKTIESLDSTDVVIVSIDYDPSSMPELQPMLKAILRHTFENNIKVIMMAFLPLGLPVGTEGLEEVAREYEKVYGEDYINLGYRPGDRAVMIDMGKEIRNFFRTDVNDIPLDSYPMMRDIHNYNDIALIIGLEHGRVGEFWIQYVGSRYNQRIVLGVTGVMAAETYPYLQSGQIEGLIGGLKGAAEYETLIKKPGFGLTGMAAQSWAHIAIVMFIIIGNIGYFMTRRKQGRL
ncbi:hypothetical protein KAW18_06215 [candidate division WOR-3 bacterium]|nr:hypothetical protein [candidate division WOR-3 bacterium]MCK4526947.1 hypothetical protein [candidate division WOR-3 bacterium]